jgi:hypothetical protein
MGNTAAFSLDRTKKRSILHEFFELLLNIFGDDGPIKNEWLMPFEPGPSSFRRKSAERRPAKPRRRRPF